MNENEYLNLNPMQEISEMQAIDAVGILFLDIHGLVFFEHPKADRIVWEAIANDKL